MAQSDKNKQPDVPPLRRNRTDLIGRDAGLAAAGAFGRAGFADPTLVLRWPDIVGPDVARIAKPIRLTEGPSGGVLTVLSEPAAALFLQHESRTLCERINTYLGSKMIAKLRFIQGNIASPRISPTHPQVPTEPIAGDPSRQFQGSERLRNALISLARARHARTPNTSD